MGFKQRLVWTTFFALGAVSAFADDNRREQLRQIYPHRPTPVAEITASIQRVAEEAAPVMNLYVMHERGLTRGRAAQQPWSGSFWPNIQGQIANTYKSKSFLRPMNYLVWQRNLNQFHARRETKLSNVYNMSQAFLDNMAPSEKYDLLLGDTNFDLTNRIWNYLDLYGRHRNWAFVSAIEMPEGYRLPNPRDVMALWEGLCHGWALAAGAVPRPEKTVTFTLPNGKFLSFNPTDIKALTSMLYANSVVQSRVRMEGYRCDTKNPRRDRYGRFMDTLPAKPHEPVLPRCADVHPAIWHMSLVNLTGVQGRSFVVEKDANNKVNNHPIQGYSYRYFNPITGHVAKLGRATVPFARYRRQDVFAASRNAATHSLVGVELTMRYTDWTMPKKRRTDSPRFDKIRREVMRYDLELDAEGNIVGGQWRVTRDARAYNGRGKTEQPDFFWTLPKDYMNDFRPLTSIGEWDTNTQMSPPAAWSDAARGAHSFVFQMTRDFGFDERCPVMNAAGSVMYVPCELRVPKPQPLINVVNKLLELSRADAAPVPRFEIPAPVEPVEPVIGSTASVPVVQ